MSCDRSIMWAARGRAASITRAHALPATAVSALPPAAEPDFCHSGGHNRSRNHICRAIPVAGGPRVKLCQHDEGAPSISQTPHGTNEVCANLPGANDKNRCRDRQQRRVGKAHHGRTVEDWTDNLAFMASGPLPANAADFVGGVAALLAVLGWLGGLRSHRHQADRSCSRHFRASLPTPTCRRRAIPVWWCRPIS